MRRLALAVALAAVGCTSGSGAPHCATFEDHTDAGATVKGPSDSVPVQYSPNCVQVKAGQSVTWNSDFTDHPLEPIAGDAGPNPIQETAAGTTVTVTFPQAGTFGFECGVHPAEMWGAVKVVP